jgi:hypothetical protein
MTLFGRVAISALLSMAALGVALAFGNDDQREWLKPIAITVFVIIGLVAVATFAVLLFREALSQCRIARRVKYEADVIKGVCAGCGYDVRGNDQRCSECGHWLRKPPVKMQIPTLESQTPAIQRVISAALDQAKQSNSDHIGTQHILLALLSDKSSAAAAVMDELGVTEQEVREAIVELLGQHRVEAIDVASHEQSAVVSSPSDDAPKT